MAHVRGRLYQDKSLVVSLIESVENRPDLTGLSELDRETYLSIQHPTRQGIHGVRNLPKSFKDYLSSEDKFTYSTVQLKSDGYVKHYKTGEKLSREEVSSSVRYNVGPFKEECSEKYPYYEAGRKWYLENTEHTAPRTLIFHNRSVAFPNVYVKDLKQELEHQTTQYSKSEVVKKHCYDRDIDYSDFELDIPEIPENLQAVLDGSAPNAHHNFMHSAVLTVVF